LYRLAELGYGFEPRVRTLDSALFIIYFILWSKGHGKGLFPLLRFPETMFRNMENGKFLPVLACRCINMDV